MLKYFKIGRYGLAALMSILCSVALRLVLLARGWPVTNSDEATMGLMARDIAYRGQLPIFFYGQYYMGALEAYIAAAVFRLSSSSLFSLRLGLVLLFALFLLSTYLLTSLLYSKAWALVVVVLLGLGSSFVLARELGAIGGYPETLLFGSLAFLLASKLALTCESGPARERWRYAGYAGWGLVVGLGLWSDLLIAPFVLCSGFLLLVCCWRELGRITAGLCALLGLVIGALPLLYYNFTAAPGEDSLSVLWQIQHSGDGYLVAHFVQQVFGTLQISIPMMTGSPFCSVPERLENGVMSSLSCTLVRVGWGAGYVLLFTLALVLAVRAVLRSPRLRLMRVSCGRWWARVGFLRGGQRQPQGIVATRASEAGRGRQPQGIVAMREKDWQSFVIDSARLLLLGSALITLLLYAMGTSPVEWPGSRSRYLIGLLIATPAILWPLWYGIAKMSSQRTGISRLSKGVCTGVLLLVMVLLLLGTVNTFGEVPAVERANQRQQALINHLVEIRATHIYSDYWTCDRLAFVSNERVICGVVEQDLQRSKNFNRDAAYYPIVSADPQACYVFSVYTPISPLAVQTKLAPNKYKHSIFEQYSIYQPLA